MSVFRRVLSTKHRVKARFFARESWIEADGDATVARRLVKERVEVYRKSESQGYGSIILMLTITATMLQIAYTLFKFWKDTRTTVPPEIPADDEPF